jgi:magnesium-protoporphyrin IX monomethyl ester (oxidative) cyclase
MERVREFKPDAVGISCIFSNQWPAVRELSSRIKAMDPEVLVLSGGAHPSFLSERCMDNAPLDYILRGEAERSLVDLLDRINAGKPVDDVDGLVWRERGSVRSNPKTGFIEDLDALPFPAHDLLPVEKYFDAALPMAYGFFSPRNIPVITSRGCPCSCTFCSSTHLWGKRYRTRSAGNVLAELDWLREEFGVEEIKFQDDNLTADRNRAGELFQGMVERPYTLNWNTPNGIALWTLDEDMLKLMKRSGCFEITLAIESGNQEVLSNLIRKPLKLDKVRDVNRLAREIGIIRGAYFIIGFPGETRAQINDTVMLSRELKLDYCLIFIYNPLPGSELFKECMDKGYITEESFFEAGNQYFTSVIDTDEWTAAELESIIRWEYMRTYLAILYNTRLVARRWYGLFRYRPSFIKYIVLRSLRALKLKIKKYYGKNRVPAVPAGSRSR